MAVCVFTTAYRTADRPTHYEQQRHADDNLPLHILPPHRSVRRPCCRLERLRLDDELVCEGLAQCQLLPQ